MITPGDLKPQRILTARRKRAFLSFRRKSDVVWFAVSLIFFSGGVTALALAVMYFGRIHHPLVDTVPDPASLALPEFASPPPPPPVMEEPQETSPLAPKSIERSPVGPVVTHVPSPKAKTPPTSSRKSQKEKRSSTLHIEVIEKWPPLPGQKPSARKKSRDPQKKTNVSGRNLPREATPPPPPKIGEYLLLREAGPFKSETHRHATLSAEPTQSEGEPALQLTYDLNNGTWVQSFVGVRENFSNFSRVQFLFMGDGSSNTLEFKMADDAGTAMGSLWSLETAKKDWIAVNLPFSQLAYLKGGGATLDLRNLRKFFFTISKKPGDKGGRGRVTIRGVRFS
jgi:hypothetical protein